MIIIGKLGRKIILSDNQVEIKIGGAIDQLFGKPSVTFMYSQIQSIELKNSRGLADATLTFIISGNEPFRGPQKAFAIGDRNPYCFFLESGQYSEAEDIRRECLKRMERIKVSEGQNAQHNTEDITIQLEKLYNFKKTGVITEDEFNNKKGELLSRM